MEECNQVFLKLKHKMTSKLILKVVDPALLFRVEVDSSLTALGAVLSQKHNNRRWHLVVFKLHKLSHAKTRYPIYEKELLALMHFLKK